MKRIERLAIKPALGGGSAPKVDRRRLRSLHTKQRIIEAFLFLLRDGNQDPRIGEIAERAGCAIRSVHERFASINDLHGAAADYAMNQAIAQAPLVDPDADRHTRIRSQVRTRAGSCERWLYLWRLLLAGRASSPTLQDKVTLARTLISQRLEAMYSPELATLPPAERNKVLVTLEALTDFESWGLMREHRKMSFDEACDIWIDAIDRLLPGSSDARCGSRDRAPHRSSRTRP